MMNKKRRNSIFWDRWFYPWVLLGVALGQSVSLRAEVAPDSPEEPAAAPVTETEPEENTGSDPPFAPPPLPNGTGNSPPSSSPSAARKKSRRIEQGLTFWLFDTEQGGWKIPLPNWSIEDVLRSLDTPERNRDDRPYIIQSLNAQGRVENHLVEMTVEYRLVTGNEPVVRVPLELPEGVWIPMGENPSLNPMLRYTGPGTCRLDIDRISGGYVAVLENPPENPTPGHLPQEKSPTGLSGESNRGGESDENSENKEGGAAENNPEEKGGPPTLTGPMPFGTEFEKYRVEEDRPTKRIGHTVTLRLFFRVENSGSDDFHLHVTFAPAVTSRLRLIVPLPDVSVDSNDAIAQPAVNLNETTSEITFSGLGRAGKTSELSWRKKENPLATVEKVMQVEEGLIVAAPDIEQIQYEATLPVRCYGGATDLLRIRLPKNAHLVRESTLVTASLGGTAIGIREVKELNAESPPSSETDRDGTIVEIRLAQEIHDSVTVQLKAVARNPLEGTATPTWELGGFELLGAQKQYGKVRVLPPKETGFNLTCAAGVRPDPTPSTTNDDESESFAFYAQPFSLQAEAILRKARISVAPEYQILVQPGRVRLAARFGYRVHGGTVRALRLKIDPDWFVTEYHPDNVIDVAKIYTDEKTGELVLPLTVPSEGMIELDLTAARDLILHQDLLELSLPVPVADWTEPAAVVIVPDDNIELIPQTELCRQLIPKGPRTVDLTMEIPSRQQSPWVYQVRSSSEEGDGGGFPLFVSAIVFHEQRVQVGVETDAVLMGRSTDVISQSFQYTIEYQPLKSVTLSVPTERKDLSTFSLTLDGKPVPSTNISTEPIFGDEDRVRKRITFPDGPRIGNCVVGLSYPCRNIELAPHMSNRLLLDFALPLDGTMTTNRLAIQTPPPLDLKLPTTPDEGWKPDEKESGGTGSRRIWRFTSGRTEPRITLRAILSGEDALGTTVVERAWIQTWLTRDYRFDRLACRLVSDQDRVELQLPSTVRPERLEVRFDNRPWFPPLADANPTPNRLVLPLEESQKGRPIVLEVSYLIPPNAPNDPPFELPVFQGASVWLRRCYWQIILPSNRHLLGVAPGWTPEYFDTTLSGPFLRRTPSMTPEELATWVGIAPPEPIAADTNVYLLSSFDPPERSPIRTMDRAVLVLFGSGLTLLVGLGFLYFPRGRRYGAILGLLILLIAVFLYRPVVVLSFLQTAALGVFLVMVAFLLKRFVTRPEPVAPPSKGEAVPLDVTETSPAPDRSGQRSANQKSASVWVEKSRSQSKIDPP